MKLKKTFALLLAISMVFAFIINASAAEIESGDVVYTYNVVVYTDGEESADGGALSVPTIKDAATISVPFVTNEGYEFDRCELYINDVYTEDLEATDSAVEYTYAETEVATFKFYFVTEISQEATIAAVLGTHYFETVDIDDGNGGTKTVNRVILFGKATGTFDEAGLLLRYEDGGMYEDVLEYGKSGVGIFKALKFTPEGYFAIDLYGDGIKPFPATYFYRYYAKTGSDIKYTAESYFEGPEPVVDVTEPTTDEENQEPVADEPEEPAEEPVEETPEVVEETPEIAEESVEESSIDAENTQELDGGIEE